MIAKSESGRKIEINYDGPEVGQLKDLGVILYVHREPGDSSDLEISVFPGGFAEDFGYTLFPKEHISHIEDHDKNYVSDLEYFGERPAYFVPQPESGIKSKIAIYRDLNPELQFAYSTLNMASKILSRS